MKKTFLLVALLALSLGANSCGNSASNGVVPAGENPGTASLVQLFPSQFIAQTNSFISLEAKVLDGNGMPVPFTPVTFTNLSLTGSLSHAAAKTGSTKAAASTVAVTNGAGIATMRISSTSAGFATIQVEVSTGAGIVRDQRTVFFTATTIAQPSPTLILDVDDGDGIPDEPADFTLFKNANDNQRLITATVFDGFGLRVAGVNVTFGSDSTDATFPNGTTATTDAFGQASVLVKFIPTSLSNVKTTLNITAQADNGAFNMITLFENPVAIATVTVSANPQSVASAGKSDISANVTTTAGTPAPDGTTVNFTLSPAQGGIDPFSQTSGGIATATFTAPTTDANLSETIKATTGGVSGQTTVTVTGSGGQPTPTPAPTPTPTPTPAPGFTISCDKTVLAPPNITSTCTLKAVSGFSTPVILTCNPAAPTPNASCTFSAAVVPMPAGGTSTLTYNCNGAGGPTAFLVVGTAGSVTQSVSMAVTCP